MSCSFSKFELFMDTLYSMFLYTVGLLSSCLARGNMRRGTRRIGCVLYCLNYAYKLTVVRVFLCNSSNCTSCGKRWHLEQYSKYHKYTESWSSVYRGSGGVVPLILNLTLDGIKWSISWSGCFNPRKGAPSVC